jgi:rhamnogalacturonyl hydrolase YesR
MHGNSKVFLLLLVVGVATAGCATKRMAQHRYFNDWPEGTAPQAIGKRVAENFVVRPFDFETDEYRRAVIYPEVCAWYGALTVAQLIRNDALQAGLIKKLEPLLSPAEAEFLPFRAHVDDRVFGVVPLEIYMLTKEPKYLELGKSYADRQWERTTPDGITREARYWIDDMYMIAAVQVQAYRATGDARYIDRAAMTMVAYLDKLQQPNGLFFHATGSPYFWGRGNGWVAAGLTELLRSIPAKHPLRARIMKGYKKMMASLLKDQGEDGLWHELLDRPEAWSETSGSGMFAFAMVTGVKSGWLDPKIYGPAARKAWLGLVSHIDKDGNITDVCVGTNRWTSYQGDPIQYYLNRARRTGDLHGQAPVLWTASALMR